jgi:SAM-dependent methyltransferase
VEPEYFDDFARDYEAILDGWLSMVGETGQAFTHRRMEYLRSHLGILPNRVMDFGCGIGLAISLLLDAFPNSEVVGVDVSRESVDVARKRYRDISRVQIALTSELKVNNFDLVYASGVFHHIPADERAAAAGFIWTSLRPGGVVMVAEHNPWNPATRYFIRGCPFDKDVRLIRPKTTTAIFEQAGFDVLARDYVSFFPGPLRALQGIETSLRRLPFGAQYVVLARRGT